MPKLSCVLYPDPVTGYPSKHVMTPVRHEYLIVDGGNVAGTGTGARSCVLI